MLQHFFAAIQVLLSSANYKFGSLTNLSSLSIVREGKWVIIKRKVQDDSFYEGAEW